MCVLEDIVCVGFLERRLVKTYKGIFSLILVT
jgi:hypothetical protein